MRLFQIIFLFVVAELSCLRHPVVYGEENLEILAQEADLQTRRTKRWLWPGECNSFAFNMTSLFIVSLCSSLLLGNLTVANKCLEILNILVFSVV